MDNFLKFSILFGSALLALGVLWLVHYMRGRRQLKTAQRDARIFSPPAEKQPYTSKLIAGLPAVVQAYFRNVLPEGQRQIQFAEIVQSGKIRAHEDAAWQEFEADQLIAVDKPGLVWDAWLRGKFGTRKSAQLMYINGDGQGVIRLFSGLTISNMSGREADVSLLFRFLAEAVWYPTALLPSEYVQWRAIDESNAKATINDGLSQAAATFTFNDKGEVTKISTDDKFRDFKGAFIKERFTMYCSAYQTFGSVNAPTDITFEWSSDRGNFTYAQFTITYIEHSYFNESRHNRNAELIAES